MHLRPILLLVLTIVFAGSKGCDINAGNIGDYIVTYDITIINAGNAPAVLVIAGKDVNRRGLVPAGGSLRGTSFVSGNVVLVAAPGEDVVAGLKAKKEDLLAQSST